MTQCTLPFDDDHIGTFKFEGIDNRCFQFTYAKLRRNCVECNAITGTLNQSGLASSNHHRSYTTIIEGSGQNRRSRALTNGTVSAEYRNTRASDLIDKTTEHS